MRATRPIIGLLVALITVEFSLLIIGSNAPLSTINQSVLLGFLFGVPTLLVGGLVVIHQQWVVMISIMYSTIALALDLATIVQEVSQPAPRSVMLLLTLVSSLVNFLIMTFGGRCALMFRPDEQPPPNLQFPA